MAEFPTSFTETPHVLLPTHVPAKHAMAMLQLAGMGFNVVAGITRQDVPGLAEIAAHESTREFCPNDITHRWANESMVAAQLTKNGGRGVLRLVPHGEDRTIGFGWTRTAGDEERNFLPKCENTFAIRLHPEARGLGLGPLFSRAIVIGSRAMWGARAIGLETWASNSGAVRAYLGAGAELVDTKPDKRPTLKPEDQDTDGNRPDTRLFMQFPWSM